MTKMNVPVVIGGLLSETAGLSFLRSKELDPTVATVSLSMLNITVF